MGSIVYSDFVAIPKFKGFTTSNTDDQALLTQLLDEAEQDVNEDYYGSKTARAIMLMAAHRFELSPATSAAIASRATGGSVSAKVAATGQLTSINIAHGSNSASFAQTMGKTREEYLVQTLWGQELIEIQRTLPVLGKVW
jgi:hypothetical protein